MRSERRRWLRGRAIVISSPSGGGKTTVVERLLRRVPSLERSVSVTTRRPRPGEREGRDYRFVSDRMFQWMRRSGRLLEWAKVHGAYYGTPRRPVLEALAKGRRVILNIDVQGARQIRRVLRRRAMLVFLVPPSLRALEERLHRRQTESTGAIRRRLAAAKREMACAAWYDATIVNDHLEDAVHRLINLVNEAGREGG